MSTPAPSSDPSESDVPLRRDELSSIFFEAEKPRAQWRIGGEAEKFGVDATSGAPLAYEGPRGVRRVLEALAAEHGWQAEREKPGGPVIALRRGEASVTLEPGAQLELSGAPAPTVHEVCAEMRAHLDELEAISREMNLVWLGVGFQPIARLEELPWVPKQRYGVMKRFLPTRGRRALDMMQRTATVQANFDYESQSDALRKLTVLLRLSPVLHAMTANSPFIEGRLSSLRSERGDVWLHMDPDRSGLIPALWTKRAPTYEDYVEWALDASMFLFRRGDAFIENTGQTFRSFLENGFEGHRAVLGDWVLHVNSLFPEARLKRTLEARSCDALPQRLACAVPALLTGLLYDDRAFDAATELVEGWRYEAVQAARGEMAAHALRARFEGQLVQAIAERVFQIAEGGLERRARLSENGQDERVHLDALRDLLERGQAPADALVERFAELGGADLGQRLIATTKIDV